MKLMRSRIPPGFDRARLARGRLRASTFAELVVTIVLLVLFASIAFSLYWGAHKAAVSQELGNAEQRARLRVATVLPRMTEKVQPPYWASSSDIFTSDGEALKAFFFDGKKDSFLELRSENNSRLVIQTDGSRIAIDDLPGLKIAWWEKDERIVGYRISWQSGSQAREFHAAWGAFIL
jgi:hypothetical protein